MDVCVYIYIYMCIYIYIYRYGVAKPAMKSCRFRTQWGFHGLSWCPQGGAILHRRQTPDSESRSLSVTLRGLAFACKRCVTGPQRSEVPSYSMIAMA